MNRKQAFSIHLVEQKRRGRTLPAVINGLTGAQAQAQGLLVEDYSDHEISSTANDETLFLPDGSSTDERAKEPVRTRTHSDAPKLQGKSSEEPSMISSYFSYLRPFQSPDQPKADNSTSTLSAKPSVSTSSQRINPYNPPLSSRRDTSTSSPFSSLNKSGSVPSPFESASKPDIKPPSLDPSKSFTSQAQSNLTSKAPSNSLSELLLSSTKARPTPGTNTPSSNSTFNSQPSPTPEPPKLKFGTSLSNATRTGNASQSEKKEDNNNNTTDLWAKSSPRATEQNVDELKPSVSTFPNAASTPYTSTPTPSPPAAAFGGDKESVSKTSQPPFSLFPASAPPKATSSIPTEPSDKPTSTPAFSFTQPLPQPPKPSLLAPPDNAAKLPEQPPFQPAPTITNQTLTAPPSSRSAPKPQSPASSIPQPAVTEAPDPRPAALDALAEGLLMEDQGLLQQFIEYTIGPIVHETFQEVEDERSWKRASQWLTPKLLSLAIRADEV